MGRWCCCFADLESKSINAALPVCRASPLGRAAELMHPEVMRALLAYGADVNGAKGEALYYSCVKDDVEAVRLLFSTAKLKLDLFDVPRLRCVVRYGHMRVISCIEELAPDRRWFTTAQEEVDILRAAVDSGSLEVLDFWLRRGCRAAVANSSALHNALTSYSPHKFAMIELLLQNGANPLDQGVMGSEKIILQHAADACFDFRIICLMLRYVTVVTDEQFIQMCKVSSFSVFHHVVDIMQHRLDPQLPLLHRGLVSACSSAATFQNACLLYTSPSPRD